MKIKWTKEKCIIAAKECNSRSDFKKRFSGAWDSAYNNGWIEEVCCFLKNPNNLSIIWTKDKCKEVCCKYDKYGEFIKSEPNVYDVLLRRKWLDECCSHMIKTQMSSGYWTEEICVNEARKYSTKKDWIINSPASYSAARKINCIDICSIHMKKLSTSFKRVIYSFEFEDNYVYIGLTYSPKRRKMWHINNENSPVFRHKLKTNINPKFKILTKKLKKEEASLVEGKILKKYEKEGWYILNKIKTGGLGGNIFVWKKNVCINEAKKYKYRHEFKLNCVGGYNSARKNGWLNECCSHMKYKQQPNGYWKNNKDRCLEEAKKYKKMYHFRIKCQGGYNAVVKNNWYNEFKELYK